jgi:hypothetical protein
MIQMFKASGGARECIGAIPAGGLAPMTDLVDSAGRLMVAGCYNDDLGGQIRTVDKDFFYSVAPGTGLPPGFLERSELLQEIKLGGDFEMTLIFDEVPSGLIIAQHIPARWN